MSGICQPSNANPQYQCCQKSLPANSKIKRDEDRITTHNKRYDDHASYRRHDAYRRTVMSKPKRRPCNRKTDNKTSRLLTFKLTFGRQKSVDHFAVTRHRPDKFADTQANAFVLKNFPTAHLKNNFSQPALAHLGFAPHTTQHTGKPQKSQLTTAPRRFSSHFKVFSKNLQV
ncbi:MAG: hypothetical protein IPH02_00725 [Sphingobacteriales bacterium]|nr:hypothetical protein [Sphingobacteriales bacterium]